MASVYNDLDRPPLNEHSLQRALMVPGGFVSALRVLPEVDSTNTALLGAAADGAPHGSVVVAEEQTAGRGRLGRVWTAPARSGLFLSILVRPKVPQDRLGWLPLLAGVAAQSAVHRIAELDVSLKWPNDLIVPGGDAGAGYGAGRKLGGILCQRGPGERRRIAKSDPTAEGAGDSGNESGAGNGRRGETDPFESEKLVGKPFADKPLADKPLGDKPLANEADYLDTPDTDGVAETAAVVVGIGLNVTLRAAELPAPHATSVALAGGSVTDRDTLLRALLRDFGSCYASWAAADGDPERSGLAAAYRSACSTLGTPVRAEMPGGGVVSGLADSIDREGRLVVVDGVGGRVPIGAGDVVHLR
jgi:BirA family transcriptional regulator, biotin operon repressor / biotin---[acetyl-CoA-carboxylase] ligase